MRLPVLLLVIVLGSLPVLGSSEAGPTSAPVDYGDRAHWLCWLGRSSDVCPIDLPTTVVEATGATRIETFTADPKPAVDCFYVYRAVSKVAPWSTRNTSSVRGDSRRHERRHVCHLQRNTLTYI